MQPTARGALLHSVSSPSPTRPPKTASVPSQRRALRSRLLRETPPGYSGTSGNGVISGVSTGTRKSVGNIDRTCEVMAGDPRRENEIRKYDRPVMNPDEQPPQPMLLLALVFGSCGLILKMKAAAWGSVVCCVSALANMKTDSIDLKQVVSVVTFGVMGLVASYLLPPPLKKQQ